MRMKSAGVFLAALLPLGVFAGRHEDISDKRRSLINDLLVDRHQITFADSPKDDCPPCFNCNLPNFECTQFSPCNNFTGSCDCKAGFGGIDCSEPLCGGLLKSNNKRAVRGENNTCSCDDGWMGINCNICSRDDVCDSFVPEGVVGTCYKAGILVNEYHLMCDVTNKKIVEILNGKKPLATFSCKREDLTCNFQFWIDQKESFFCDLNSCDFKYDAERKQTHYTCENMACKCLPDRMLCGEDGSIDISEFLTETIRGPGFFQCDTNKSDCIFSEPSMNDLISQVFGDSSITLHCDSGECLHKSEIPGYDLPEKDKLTIGSIITIVSVFLVCLLIIFFTLHSVRKSPLFQRKSASDFANLDDSLDNGPQPIQASLTFENIEYSVGDNQILKGISGTVLPRECMAIMGGSGAGKTTLLDILANKNKSGKTSGTILVNGKIINPKSFKKIIGFVDQEDHLISTLTVYETVLNSALLRLPRTMPLRAVEAKVVEVLNELRILGIKDRVIGSGFKRGISGGEKRRVSIACELVTSPSILFLDEPTSGLDAYNAHKVVESLVRLAKDFQRTIVFTIHQPRSNIVSLFDDLILLSKGQLIYSGDMIKTNDYFSKVGYPCPLGYNIADYLIDITLASKHDDGENGVDLLAEDLHGQFVSNSSGETNDTQAWEHFAEHRDEIVHAQQKSSSVSSKETSLAFLFKNSVLYAELNDRLSEIKNSSDDVNFDGLAYKKASWISQVMILSSRTFKNLYRNPRLLLSHYVLSLFVGLFCGYLYYDSPLDISGFQNRLGLFFFILALFGFSSLTGLHAFASERIIFIRERANNYYHPSAYYVSKILCDVVPMRVLPPVILISVTYPLVGLTMEHNGFLKCLMVLVLFNLTVAVELLIVGVLIGDPGVSTMIGVLLMLFSLLFAGLFINNDELKGEVKWMEWISMFHYAYESLSINEVKDLMLREKKYGLSIEVPGAVILSSFGFNVEAFWDDVSLLGLWLGIFFILGYIFLHTFVVEKR